MLAQINWLAASLIVVFLFISVLMILVVLIQRPAGGGLSGAFGSGAGSGQTAFGAKTGDALTIATITIFIIYILFAVGLNFAARPAELDDAPPAAALPAGAAPAETPAETPGALPPESQPGGVFSPAPEIPPSEQPVMPPTELPPATPPEVVPIQPAPTTPPTTPPTQPEPEQPATPPAPPPAPPGR